MPFLRSMGAEYANERAVPNPPERDSHFRHLETELQSLIRVSDLFRASRGHKAVAENLPQFGQGRVKALAQWHQQQAKAVTWPDVINTCIIHTRQWLFRQGARIRPNGSIIWERSHARVLYDDTLAKQEFTKVTVKNGVMTQTDGKKLDTGKMVTALNGPGWAIYVMSGEGNLHVSSHSVGHRHHSSLLAAAPVAGAGEMKVIQGRLRIITNKSGHYKPEPYFLLQVMDRLLADGVSIQTEVWSFTAKNPPQIFANYDLFRRAVAFPIVQQPIPVPAPQPAAPAPAGVDEDAIVFEEEAPPPPAGPAYVSVSVPGYRGAVYPDRI